MTDEKLAAELRAALARVQSLKSELNARGWTVCIRINDGVKVEIEKRIEL